MSPADESLTLEIRLDDADGAQPMGAAEFTQFCAERLRMERPDAAVAIADDLHLKVKDDGGAELDLGLDNAFKQYVRAPEDLEDVVARHLRAMASVTEASDSQVNEGCLLPVLRSRAFLENMRQVLAQGEADGEGARPVADRINDEISVLYVFDTEDAMRYMQVRDLENLPTDRTHLFRRAVANLREVLKDARVEGGEGYFMPVAGGDYESSLLFLSEFWTEERFPVKGEIVVFPLARDLLIVTGSEERKALAEAMKLAVKAEATMDYFISDKPFLRKDGRWVRFSPPKRGWWPFGR